jgi:hypothetical protein
MNHNENRNGSSLKSEAADAGRIWKAHEPSTARDSPSMPKVTSKKAAENIGLASMATPDKASLTAKSTTKAKTAKTGQPIEPSSMHAIKSSKDSNHFPGIF